MFNRPKKTANDKVEMVATSSSSRRESSSKAGTYSKAGALFWLMVKVGVVDDIVVIQGVERVITVQELVELKIITSS